MRTLRVVTRVWCAQQLLSRMFNFIEHRWMQSMQKQNTNVQT